MIENREERDRGREEETETERKKAKESGRKRENLFQGTIIFPCNNKTRHLWL